MYCLPLFYYNTFFRKKGILFNIKLATNETITKIIKNTVIPIGIILIFNGVILINLYIKLIKTGCTKYHKNIIYPFAKGNWILLFSNF